jgi:hypothetical protein
LNEGTELPAASPSRKQLHLTVCLNGLPWTTDDFSTGTTVDQVISATLEHFAAEGVTGQGEFALARVVYGYANPPLDGHATLGHSRVKNGSLLTLIPRDPP